MKKSFLLHPLLLGFIVLVSSGFFYVHNTLTKHNFGFRYSKKFATSKVKVGGQKQHTVRVLSYNVHGLPNTSDPWCDNLIRIGEMLGAMRTVGTAPDIIALQEGFHEKIHDLIRLSGYPYAAQGPAGTSGEMTSGLWILSEFPIKAGSSTIFQTCATWDCLANKGVQQATIVLPGKKKRRKIQIYNTHMNASPSFVDVWTTKEELLTAKQGQIRQFHNYLDKTRKKSLPSIVLGDFNFRSDSDLFRNFEARLGRFFSNAALGILGKVPRKMVDHHFFVSGTKGLISPVAWQKVFEERTNSDHDGVLVKYRLVDTARHL